MELALQCDAVLGTELLCSLVGYQLVEFESASIAQEAQVEGHAVQALSICDNSVVKQRERILCGLGAPIKCFPHLLEQPRHCAPFA